jgi:Subtilase family
VRALTGPAAALALALPGAPPMQLPGDAHSASVRADRATWIVGARPSARLPRAFGARRLTDGVWVVARSRARPLARALRARGQLVFAEPNRISRELQAPPPDPMSSQTPWRDQVVEQGLAPPPVTPTSPLLALVDSQLDATHPEFQGGNVSTVGNQPVVNEHGTATAAVAAAPSNQTGILGIWPGMRALNVALPGEITCADSVHGLLTAIKAKAQVINMSYGSPSLCFAEYLTIQAATAAGVTVVAASGNEFANGNPLEFPASLPHVLTVAAVGPDLHASYFSSTSAAVDIAAPGQDILTAVPTGFDPEPPADGYAHLDGTSFAAPMVAAAAAWVRAARPDLRRDQVAQVLHAGAQDLERPGWDPATGWGLVSVGGALRAKTPPEDPLEPNDDIVWIDGRAFGHADPPVYSGKGTRRVLAELDEYEDPNDVYRVVVPGRRKARVTIKPVSGDPDLSVYNRAARAVADRRDLVSASHHTGRKGDGVTVFNRSRSKRTYYARVFVHRGSPRLDSAYVMRVQRVR